MRPPPPFRLLAITPPSGAVDLEVVDRWLAAGAAEVGIAVLLREPGARLATLVDPAGRLGPLARRCRERGVALLASLAADELPQIAALAAAHELAGAQLRGDPSLAELTDLAARAPTLIRGRSCHGAPQPGDPLVDYTCLAPIFPPRTAQPGVEKIAVGLAPLAAWADAGARVLALGGVTPGRVEACVAAGAFGIAGIGLFFGDPRRVGEDVAAVASRLARPPDDVRPLPR